MDLLTMYSKFVDYRDSGNLTDAIATLTEVLQIAPDWDHGLGWMELAGAHLMNGAPENAVLSCEKALEFSGMGDFVNPILAVALSACGKLEESWEVLREILVIEVNRANASGELQLNRAVTRTVENVQKNWIKHNSNLYERLSSEFSEGNHYWKVIESNMPNPR